MIGEEEQIGGFDLIYKAKPIKILFGKNNFSMLGCLNNRHQQLKKVAKAVALKFTHAEKKKEEASSQQQASQPQQKKAWGANNVTGSSSKTADVGMAKRIANSVEPSRFGKPPQTQTHVKFPDINGKQELPVRKMISNLSDNARYKITR